MTRESEAKIITWDIEEICPFDIPEKLNKSCTYRDSMFIRIKRRRLKSAEDDSPDYSLRVYLVENRRVKGNPRQRVISYLGSIRMSDLPIESRRKIFLNIASKRIGAMTSDLEEIIRLKRSMIKLIVSERYSNWATSDWTEAWFQNSTPEHIARKLQQAKAEFATATDDLRRTIWNLRRARAEEELARRSKS
jgi:hypothetical protein